MPAIIAKLRYVIEYCGREYIQTLVLYGGFNTCEARLRSNGAPSDILDTPAFRVCSKSRLTSNFIACRCEEDYGRFLVCIWLGFILSLFNVSIPKLRHKKQQIVGCCDNHTECGHPHLHGFAPVCVLCSCATEIEMLNVILADCSMVVIITTTRTLYKLRETCLWNLGRWMVWRSPTERCSQA